jgi:hypothetical protein
MSDEAYKAIKTAAERLTDIYKLEPYFAVVGIRPGLTTIHVFTIRGQENFMPELPETFEGFPITRSKMSTPYGCRAA